MKENILVTGGAGFIGSAFVKRALKGNYNVFIYDNFSFGKKEFLESDSIRIIEGDIRDRDRIRQVVLDLQPDYLVHLAAIHFIPFCNQHPVEASEVNILGTINVLDAAKNYGKLKKFFFASTAAVYPIMDGAISETTTPAPLDIYGLTKLAGERIVHEFYLETSTPTVICRFFNAFGPNETNMHIIPVIEEQIRQGRRTLQLGNMDPKRDFIHTYDMAEALIRLFEKFDVGFDIFNLGRGIEYSMHEVVAAFSSVLEEEITVETDPERVRKSDRMHLLADISKIRQFTGWAPKIELRDGISTLLKHMPIGK
jgi:UDP-glucose 4-epimerase